MFPFPQTFFLTQVLGSAAMQRQFGLGNQYYHNLYLSNNYINSLTFVSFYPGGEYVCKMPNGVAFCNHGALNKGCYAWQAV